MAGVLTLSAASLPVAGLQELVLSAYGWAFIGLVWILSFLLARAARELRPALIAPVLVMIIAPLTFSGLPRMARVAWNDQALTSYVAKLESGEITPPPRYDEDSELLVGNIPLYWVEEYAGRPHLVNGFVGSDTPAGLVRLPDGQLPRSGLVYQHIHGEWFIWTPW